MNYADFCPWNCDNLKDPIGGNYWIYSDNNSSANSVVVNFPGFWNVDMIRLYDVNDIGLFQIQYQDVNGAWHTVDKYLTVRYEDWTILTNFAPHGTPIDRLRFNMAQFGNIGEITVCAQPLFGLADDSEGTYDKVGYPRITPVSITEDTPGSLLVQWDALPADDEGSTFLKKYLVRYSLMKDDQGNLVEPRFKEVMADEHRPSVETRIDTLGSGIHYVHISPGPCDEDACRYSLEDEKGLISLGSHSFKMEGSQPERKAMGQGGSMEMRVLPNPTTGNVKVELPSHEFSLLELFDLNGKALQSYILGEETLAVQVSVENLPPGIYFILARKPNGEQASAKLVKE